MTVPHSGQMPLVLPAHPLILPGGTAGGERGMIVSMKKTGKKKARTPKPDQSQLALSVVEKAIAGKLANGSIERRTKRR